MHLLINIKKAGSSAFVDDLKFQWRWVLILDWLWASTLINTTISLEFGSFGVMQQSIKGVGYNVIVIQIISIYNAKTSCMWFPLSPVVVSAIAPGDEGKYQNNNFTTFEFVVVRMIKSFC